jgi:hypothetical protein
MTETRRPLAVRYGSRAMPSLLSRACVVLFASLGIFAIASCSSKTPAPGPVVVADGCDPIAPEHCGLPFPNDFWRDASGHIAFGANTVPVAQLRSPIDATTFAWKDGFSPGQAAFTYLPGATATGLPDENSIATTVTLSSPTILMDAVTGDLVPHFSEIDQSTHNDDQAIMVHPVVRLLDAHRYIVAVRNVVDDSGALIPPSVAFQALRDGSTTGDAATEARRPHIEDLFTTLTAHGVDRGSLQIAWDYTTASTANTTTDLLTARDRALAAVGLAGPSYTITQVEKAPNQYLALRLHGMMTVPLFLNRPDAGDDVKLMRDAQGLPTQNGTADYPFVILIPNSATPTNPAPILQNGHGLLGSLDEGTDSYFAEMCNLHNYIGVAVDWVGMAHDDDKTMIDAITQDLTIFHGAVDRQHQGFVNALLAMRMMIGKMKDDPNLEVDGKTILDPTHAYYRGDSQGGIFGTTYMSISTDVTRGLLGEPGMPYELLLDRSADFSGFKLLLHGAYPNGLDQRFMQGLLQIEWDRTEPNGYAAHLAQDPLPGTPVHRVLIAAGIGDHQVTTLGAHFVARTIGAQNIGPLNRENWGVSDASGPVTTGSAITEYSFGLPPVPTTNVPMTLGADPHGLVRSLVPAMAQADEFFRNGDIKSFCDGPCDPM